MTGIGSIPTTRVSDLLARQRLTRQLQFDQLEIFKLQEQISTGRRITVPSQDAPAALRAISLQRLLEQKAQAQDNLTTNELFLNATDSALSGIANLVVDIRASTLAVVDSSNSDAQRLAVAQEVDRAIQQLVDVGNQKFRGRYLFSGSRTDIKPFENVDGFIRYSGNDERLLSYSDVDLLFETNLDGDAVFGGISEEIRGDIDLNPILVGSTRLTSLRGGEGISSGSINISDGVNNSVIDISSAETIGDVARLIEANPPAGRAVDVRVTPTGLEISLDTSGGGNLTIREVGGGTTASELGVLEETGVGVGPLVGDDLDPRLALTTSLGDILGTRSTAFVPISGNDNDLVFTATQRGSQFNDVTISFVDGAVAGAETVVYDDTVPTNKTLTVTIESGVSTAEQIIAAVAAAGVPFTAALDPDESGTPGQGVVTVPVAAAVTAGGGGIELDQSSGLQIVNGGQTHVISIQSAQTIEDVLNTLNGSDAEVVAHLNEAGTGIDVRSRLSGSDFAIGENGGLTATHLGIRSFDGSTRLDELNFGRGVHVVDGPDFTIRRKDGTEFSIDLTGLDTIADVAAAIITHGDNPPGPDQVIASLNATGNGLHISTASVDTTADLAVLRTNGSFAAVDLGLVPEGEDQVSATHPGQTISGRDVNYKQVDGLFSSLVRLKSALEANDQIAIERAVESLDAATLDLNFSRAELGARQQGLDVLGRRLENEDIEIQNTLSIEIDADIVEVYSEFTSRQAAMQASLQMAAQLFQFTLLNFL